MAQECELLKECGFLRKYQNINPFACKGFIKKYCRGPRMPECKRMQYSLEHGTQPSDDMLPTGDILRSVESHQCSTTKTR
jgi:hypothetical protein